MLFKFFSVKFVKSSYVLVFDFVGCIWAIWLFVLFYSCYLFCENFYQFLNPLSLGILFLFFWGEYNLLSFGNLIIRKGQQPIIIFPKFPQSQINIPSVPTLKHTFLTLAWTVSTAINLPIMDVKF